MATIELEITNDLNAKLEKKIKGTEFSSVQKYVKYVLYQVVSDIDSTEEDPTYSEEEGLAMKKRLEELGYT